MGRPMIAIPMPSEKAALRQPYSETSQAMIGTITAPPKPNAVVSNPKAKERRRMNQLPTAACAAMKNPVLNPTASSNT